MFFDDSSVVLHAEIYSNYKFACIYLSADIFHMSFARWIKPYN